MYAQLLMPKSHGFNDSQLNFQKCILTGNWLMIVSLLIVSTSVLISFPLEQYFTIGSQIVAHISTIIFAAVIKIGYVVRCVGEHGLGARV